MICRHQVAWALVLLFALVSGCGGDGAASRVDASARPLSALAAPDAVAVFAGNRNNYSIVQTSNGWLVTDLSGTGGVTTLTSATTTLQFADFNVNLGIGPKSQSISDSDLKSISELYVAFFNRLPDADGLSYWIDQFKSGMSLAQMCDNFYAAAIQYSSLTGYSATMTNADFVAVIYKNVLGRTSVDAGGLQYWTTALASGAATRGTLVQAILASAHSFKGDATWGWVADLLDDKYTVAKYFAVQQGLNYASPSLSISSTMSVAAAVTPINTSSAIAQIGVTDVYFSTVPRSAGDPPLQKLVADIGGVPFRAASPASFEAGSAFTMEGWVYLTQRTRYAWIIGKGIPTPSQGTALISCLMLDSQGERLQFSTDAASMFSPAALPLRQWTHVAASLDQGTMRLYVNGQLVASQSGFTSIKAAPTIPLGIGASFTAAGESFGSEAGFYARQVRFWNVARSAAQITAAMVETLPSNATGLVGAWPLDDAVSATTARDLSGNGLSLSRAMSGGSAHVAVLESGPWFTTTSVALPAGLMTDPSEAVMFDFANDGTRGVVIGQVAPSTYPATDRRPLAFRYEANTLVDASTAVFGTATMINPRRYAVTDVNGDGRVDLVIADTGTDTWPYPGTQQRVFVQSPDGQLVDETSTRLPPKIMYAHGMAVDDIDGNGAPDVLFVTINDNIPHLYMNDGAGHYTEDNSRLPDEAKNGLVQFPSAAFCDVNGDGRPDLVLGASYYSPNGPTTNTPNVLLMNDGTGRFVRDATRSTLPPKLHGITGLTVDIACADLNSDGAPDLLLSTSDDTHDGLPGLQLLMNDGSGHFTDATDRLHLAFGTQDGWIVAIHVIDVNGDGHPDILLRMNSRNYAPANFTRTLLLNKGNGEFVDASEVLNVNTTYGLAVGDIDQDGRVDAVVPINPSEIRILKGAKSLDPALFQE